jgi:hypothetical protein
MKTIKAITLMLAISFASTAKADGLMDGAKNYLMQYGAPCLAGLAGGYLIDKNKALPIGAAACGIVITYGEFGAGSRKSVSVKDASNFQRMLKEENQRIESDFDSKIDRINADLLKYQNNSKSQIRESVTDLGVYLEHDMEQKVDRKIEEKTVTRNLQNQIRDQIKDEVQSELRSRERDIVNKATESVIKRVTAEPIIVDEPVRKKDADQPK